MNYRVLQVLIETGYCQKVLNEVNKSDYPRFLITVLSKTDKNAIKEACCRMIIKYFGKTVKDEDGPAEGEDAGKI